MSWVEFFFKSNYVDLFHSLYRLSKQKRNGFLKDHSNSFKLKELRIRIKTPNTNIVHLCINTITFGLEHKAHLLSIKIDQSRKI